MSDYGEVPGAGRSEDEPERLDSIRSRLVEGEGGTADAGDDVELEPIAPHAVKRRKSGLRRFFEEWVVVLAVAGAVAVIVRLFVFSPFYIPSGSMHPTLWENDKILINKLSYRLHDVHRGDVVVFERPKVAGLGEDIKDLVKRVIGLPGDRLEIRDGKVIINGQLLEEPYVKGVATDTSFEAGSGADPDGDGVAVVPKGMVFVMGDNRAPSGSFDSRFWGFLDEDLIEGRAFVVYWPRGHWQWL